MLLSGRDSFVDEDHKRILCTVLLYVAPGPGVYRLPSDFGHYDEPPISGRSSLMGRTTARSKFIQ